MKYLKLIILGHCNFIFCLTVMKENRFLQNSIRISQIQARLAKNSYFSRGNLPSGADAKVFFFIQKLKKVPSKKIHPNLYHWYILIKQFSTNSLKSWQKNDIENEEIDKFISEFIGNSQNNANKNNRTIQSQKDLKLSSQMLTLDLNDKILTLQLTPRNISKNTKINNENKVQQQQPLILQIPHSLKERSLNKSGCDEIIFLNALNNNKHEIYSPLTDYEYVMEMQLKTEHHTPIKVLKERLEQQKIELLSYEGQEGVNMRVVFRIEKDECERLKDKISKWEEISNFQFRKEKKSYTKSEWKSQKSTVSPREYPPKLAF